MKLDHFPVTRFPSFPVFIFTLSFRHFVSSSGVALVSPGRRANSQTSERL